MVGCISKGMVITGTRQSIVPSQTRYPPGVFFWQKYIGSQHRRISGAGEWPVARHMGRCRDCRAETLACRGWPAYSAPSDRCVSPKLNLAKQDGESERRKALGGCSLQEIVGNSVSRTRGIVLVSGRIAADRYAPPRSREQSPYGKNIQTIASAVKYTGA